MHEAKSPEQQPGTDDSGSSESGSERTDKTMATTNVVDPDSDCEMQLLDHGGADDDDVNDDDDYGVNVFKNYNSQNKERTGLLSSSSPITTTHPEPMLMAIPTPVDNGTASVNGSATVVSSGSSSSNTTATNAGTKVLSPDVETTSAKSIPVHCVVEQVISGSQEPQVEIDTYAILPASTLFCELVRATLVKIGYSPTEALGAKGAIQIKRWKPLTFDTITDDPDATLEDILGELSSIATVRIRLCSQLQLFAMDDIKEKLLQFLLHHSQGLLTSTGCPIEKNLLIKIAQGDCPKSLPEDTQEAFTVWFRDQVQKGFVKNSNKAKPTSENQSELPSSSPDQVQMSPNLPQGTGMPHFLNEPTKGYPGIVHIRPRARTSFDPEFEVPRLQKWFEQNQHPTRDQMCAFMNELNNQPSRQGRRPLDLTNIIYWFKNARAANRRAILASKDVDLNGYLDSSFGESSNGDENDDCFDDREINTSSPAASTGSNNETEDRHVPELPNPFAVYVVKPIHHPSSSSSSSKGSPEKVEVVDYDKDENKPQDFSVSKLNGSYNRQSQHQQQLAHSHHNNNSGPLLDSDKLRHQSNKENERISSQLQAEEQATDLSLPKKRKFEEENEPLMMNGHSDHPSKMSRLMIPKDERLPLHFSSVSSSHHDDDDYGSSNASSPSPSPKSLNSSTSSSGLNTSQHHPLSFHHTMTQQALQMAAMSHAFNMHHYMHPAAAMYGGPLVPPPVSASGYHNNNSINTSPRPTPSPGSNSLNSSSHHMSSEDRKKRSRVFIDPLTEIPKLEKWFLEDTHPSSYMIEKYTEELNMQPYRQRFPCLEPKNVQLWFKNHRAKVKRARQEQAALCQINHVNAIASS